MPRLRQAAALFILLLLVAPVAPAEPACETATEPIGPPVPRGRDPGGVAVALIDSGIAYDLPEVSKRLSSCLSIGTAYPLLGTVLWTPGWHRSGSAHFPLASWLKPEPVGFQQRWMAHLQAKKSSGSI